MEYIEAKTIISKAKNTEWWFDFDYNMNLYKGCCHGCIYCDSRSECYRITDFDTIKIKKNCIEILEKQLISKRKKGIIATGAMSDPYNPLEKKYELTKKSLQLIKKYGYGLLINTKSSLINRDIEIIRQISEKKDVLIGITVTTSNQTLCNKIEPNTSTTIERIETIKKFTENKIYTGILLMPILPFLNDTIENIDQIIEYARYSKADFIYPYFGVTLRQNQKDHYLEKIQQINSGLKQKYLNLYRNIYSCLSPNHKKLKQHFISKCEKYNITYKMQDIIKSYKTPKTNPKKQMTLF